MIQHPDLQVGDPVEHAGVRLVVARIDQPAKGRRGRGLARCVATEDGEPARTEPCACGQAGGGPFAYVRKAADLVTEHVWLACSVCTGMVSEGW